ncbi:UpxY family transcription antiterminator [Maribellus sp. YY47]|uniref:UpxY family transcription antiterminator n=1 Tax=Maribellus sp. YY47 TaxID=2929486 RepID=UPI002001C8DE|nr:UpxY family transcription antiterminator [Maribellus sp. YY47]MCK3685185.1 UpxY family transcription antiterminator [Maribellus sp. YY47]
MRPTNPEVKNWYAIYTRSRAEKRVNEDLQQQGIESFLPIQRKLRQWKDRKKWVEVPLISGYCFVNVTRKDYDRVLQNNNVVCYITFEGKAAAIREDQIAAMKRMLQQNDFEVNINRETFAPGKKVEIIQGPLVGLRGELAEIRGKNKFILRIEQIDQSFSIEVPAEHLSALPEEHTLVS